jgi:hypothetical protein
MRASISFLLAAALAVSLAFHARALFLHPSPAPRPAATAAVTASPPAGDCEERLGRCESRSWDLLRKALSAPAPETRDSGAARPLPPAPAPPSARAAREAALCRKAKESLREGWERDREKIVSGMTKGLADRDEQDAAFQREVAELRDMAGVDPANVAELERDYRDARFARIDAAQTALAADPPDLGAVTEAARALFADEDRLAEQFGGAAGRDAYQEEQRDGRVMTLALLVTLAGKDFEEALR